MANQNVTQLTQQTVTANSTSLFYAVINGVQDTGLPLSVFVNSLGLTGVPTTPTATTGTNSTQIASTAFVQNQLTSTLTAYAKIASPTFTGTVVIPTVTLSGGTINGTSVGATTASTGAFTTLTASSTATLNTFASSGATITGGSINGTPVGATAASTGTFTTLSASSTVSGTGFSTYLASPPAIGGTAAAAGSFTTLSSTGNFTPSQTNGIVGTTTNNSANAGSVGEFVTATGTTVSLTSSTPANVTSISLTAGDWDVWGNCEFDAAATTVLQQMFVGINTVSASNPTAPNRSVMTGITIAANSAISLIAPQQRLLLSATTTVYLVADAVFTTSTATATGQLNARRRR